jgi:hypothetical protein
MPSEGTQNGGDECYSFGNFFLTYYYIYIVLSIFIVKCTHISLYSIIILINQA